jgi:hypothetical protein
VAITGTDANILLSGVHSRNPEDFFSMANLEVSGVNIM